MPIYEYKCENGHVFDVLQRMSDEPLTSCEECGAPAERVLHPVAVHFKGSGFYNTDYGKRKGAASGDSAEKPPGDSGGSGSKSGDGGSGSGEKASGSKAAASAD